MHTSRTLTRVKRCRPAVALITMVALLGLGACGRSIRGLAPVPAPATTPSETPAPPPTTTTTMPALVSAGSPEQGAANLLAAWRAGDRAGAARLAPPAAVDALFALPPGPTQARGCDQSATGPRNCVYRLGNRLLRIKLVGSAPGWTVNAVEVS